MKITVVGDTLLDADVHGSARRLLPDNPVPVVDVDHTDHRPGGAGLATLLLAAAGHEVTLVTVLGNDENAERIETALPSVDVVAARLEAPTPVKRRLLAEGQLVTRMDENCSEAGVEVTEEMLACVRSAEAVLVSDYGRHLSEDTRLRAALEEAAAKVPVVWDPHPAGGAPVAGAAAVTPNFAEALTLTENPHGPETSVPEAHTAAEALLERWQSQAVVVTLGARGALTLEAGAGARFSPTLGPTTGDACGAGDCFAGCLTAGLAAGTDLMDAVDRAIAETGEFIVRGGVDALTRAQESETALLGTHEEPGAASPAVQRARAVRARGGTVVATGGCFDLLHAGHVRALSAARRMGDTLIVLLNSDESVRRLKGAERPIVGSGERAELLRALDCVDDVLVFEEDTPVSALEQIRPDIWVKSDDYRHADLEEAEVLTRWEGRIVTVPFVPMHSTSNLAGALRRLDSSAV
ncbi:PfkB family carbohydrate kinase [Brevibacterium renqingii]|uniref:PfkB family carbohydrate kinase n=1 Tax=Brevibacterium renqingii TaxID=2776916 RepID=UPI001ADEF619|nr:PfkB family carbohydrate kinase [Brevibacterium renqingii]